MMQEKSLILTAANAQALPARERVGLAVARLDVARLVKTIIAAEEAGVRQIWSTQSPLQPDTLTVFAAAAVQTRSIRLGSAIIPTYPRHPLTMAAQALALNELAPGRLRLGLGSSHKPIIEGVYGMELVKPLEYLHEYVEIVRAALWDGKVDYQGKFFTVKGTLPNTAPLPVLTSVLRENAFKLAGEISDGALSWLCPVPYLLQTGLPALRASAQEHGRPAPPLVAHVLAAGSSDRSAVIKATRAQIQSYGKLPFYASMFANAGYPVDANGTMSDDLIGSLVISGSATTITGRFKELLASGLDEILVMPITVQQEESELHQLMQLIGGL
jgi:alkanesulfonate monooxygenase SsuD/methylene tetrahydromethanopterin reductase-like flavin-dependent oxidoreductase (luciferase family)